MVGSLRYGTKSSLRCRCGQVDHDDIVSQVNVLKSVGDTKSGRRRFKGCGQWAMRETQARLQCMLAMLV